MLNNIWKKVWRLRKGFLTKSFKLHYSQFGEDIVLNEILKKEVKKGFFVDIGCYHPKKHSNTYMLYKRGWSGINIDMEDDKISLFNMIRKRDHNVLSAVSDKNEEVTIYRYSKYGLESTISNDLAEKSNDEIYDKKIIQARTINSIIEESPYKGKQIDVLSIDVEGMDFVVLNSLDFKKYQPKIIIAEDYNTNIEAILESDIYKLLKSHSYVLRSWTFYSLIFVLPNNAILKDREKN